MYDNNIIYFLLHIEFLSQVRHDKYVSIITAGATSPGGWGGLAPSAILVDKENNYFIFITYDYTRESTYGSTGQSNEMAM